MRIFYCFENEEDKYVTEIIDAWLDKFDNDPTKTKFCFQDITNITYYSETIPYDYGLMLLRTLAKNGYVNLENHIFEVED